MENRFDTLAKSLAGGLSRREALRCFGGFVGGSLLAFVGIDSKASAKHHKPPPPPPPPSPCDVQCQRLQKISRNKEFDVTACKDTCDTCGQGPQTCMTSIEKFFCCSGPTSLCCDGIRCVDTSSDNNNCGSCGNRCSAQHLCRSGHCVAHDSCPLTGRCPNVPSCGSNAFCVETTEGTKQCVANPSSCSAVPRCNTSKDCPIGQVCVTTRSSCCLTNVCASIAGIGVGSAAGAIKGRNLGGLDASRRSYA